MKFSVDVENISKILFLDFSFFENMSLKNISAWLGGNCSCDFCLKPLSPVTYNSQIPFTHISYFTFSEASSDNRDQPGPDSSEMGPGLSREAARGWQVHVYINFYPSDLDFSVPFILSIL